MEPAGATKRGSKLLGTLKEMLARRRRSNDGAGANGPDNANTGAPANASALPVVARSVSLESIIDSSATSGGSSSSSSCSSSGSSGDDDEEEELRRRRQRQDAEEELSEELAESDMQLQDLGFQRCCGVPGCEGRVNFDSVWGVLSTSTPPSSQPQQPQQQQQQPQPQPQPQSQQEECGGALGEHVAEQSMDAVEAQCLVLERLRSALQEDIATPLMVRTALLLRCPDCQRAIPRTTSPIVAATTTTPAPEDDAAAGPAVFSVEHTQGIAAAAVPAQAVTATVAPSPTSCASADAAIAAAAAAEPGLLERASSSSLSVTTAAPAAPAAMPVQVETVMRCRGCRRHFCGVCFGYSASARKSCLEHALKVHGDEEFMVPEVILAARKAWRISRLCGALRTQFGAVYAEGSRATLRHPAVVDLLHRAGGITVRHLTSLGVYSTMPPSVAASTAAKKAVKAVQQRSSPSSLSASKFFPSIKAAADRGAAAIGERFAHARAAGPGREQGEQPEQERDRARERLWFRPPRVGRHNDDDDPQDRQDGEQRRQQQQQQHQPRGEGDVHGDGRWKGLTSAPTMVEAALRAVMQEWRMLIPLGVMLTLAFLTRCGLPGVVHVLSMVCSWVCNIALFVWSWMCAVGQAVRAVLCVLRCSTLVNLWVFLLISSVVVSRDNNQRPLSSHVSFALLLFPVLFSTVITNTLMCMTATIRFGLHHAFHRRDPLHNNPHDPVPIPRADRWVRQVVHVSGPVLSRYLSNVLYAAWRG